MSLIFLPTPRLRSLKRINGKLWLVAVAERARREVVVVMKVVVMDFGNSEVFCYSRVDRICCNLHTLISSGLPYA